MANAIANGFLRDATGALVTGSAAPETYKNGFLRDNTGALVLAGSSGAYADGFVRDATGILQTVDFASAAGPTAIKNGFLRDANNAVVTTTSPSGTPTYKNGWLRDNNYSLVLASTLTPPPSTNLAAWFKADSLALSDGTAVSSWADSSGNGNTATQGVGANQPTFNTAQVNGWPAVTFGGTHWMQTAALASYSPVTLLAVVNPTNFLTSPGAAIWGSQVNAVGGVEWRVTLTTGKQGFLKQGAVNIGSSTTGLTAGVYTCIDVTYDGTTASFFKTAAADGTGASAQTFGASGAWIGQANNTERWLGGIAEILVYNGIVPTDRQAAEVYLRTKYAI